MFAGLFAKQDLVDAESAEWLCDTFAWSLRNFGADVFFNESRLVTPSDADFPGRADTPEGMAQLIFGHVLAHAGMGHWPMRLGTETTCALTPPGRLEIQGALRGSKGVPQRVEDPANSITLIYDPQLARNPEAMIAVFAHALAHYLGQTAKEPPPGGMDHWPQATEVVAVFMGFGLMFANSAFRVPIRSCGSCGGPPVDRQSFLTQHESTYALAIFSVLKDIPAKTVSRHLKQPLRPFFRKCVKELRGKPELLERLRAVSTVPEPTAAEGLVVSS